MPECVWGSLIPDPQWVIYEKVLREAQARGIPFALGGAFAIAAYTGSWRNTKDLDLYVRRRDRDSMVEILDGAGLGDYHGELPYDRRWIYRSIQGGVIVDIIWSMANRRAEVDDDWLFRGLELNLRGIVVRAVPAEEMVWNKLYVLQRDRCDWPDVIKLLLAAGPALEWERLLARMGEDQPLLAGVLSVFAWVCPGRSLELPHWVWGRLGLRAPVHREGPPFDPGHVDLLDSRPWLPG